MTDRGVVLIYRQIIALLSILYFSTGAQAGVVIGGTRVVFHESEAQHEILIRNTSNIPFLVTGRVVPLSARDNADTDKRTGLNVVPPAFVMRGGTERVLRIIDRSEGRLPGDRETMMYLVVSSVPEGGSDKNAVQFSMRNWIKLFYRPSGLEGMKIPPLKVISDASGIVMKNDSPFYVSLSGVTVGERDIPAPSDIEPYGKMWLRGCGDTLRCRVSWRQADERNEFTSHAAAAQR